MNYKKSSILLSKLSTKCNIMNDIDKIFMLQWIGPFANLEELKKWELVNMNCSCNLYMLTGKEYHHRTISDYVGITEQEYIYKRLRCNHDKFKKIVRDLNIWVGHFSCSDHAIHENISIVETLLISSWQPQLNEKKKVYFPNQCICVINQWYKPNKTQYINRVYPAQYLQDVIVYNSEAGKIWGAERLKKLN